MTKDTNKSDESNKKRLESLKKQAEEFKKKKTLVRSSLNDLEAANTTKVKKIVFDDSDSDSHQEVAPKPKKTSTEKPKLSEPVKPSINKKLSLIGSDDEDDKDDSHQDLIDSLERKINLKEDKANQLIYLKSKFSNDDNRFKIDDRFIEDNSDKEDDQPKSTKKKIKSENLNALKILESITGKQIIKVTDTTKNDDSKKKGSASKAKVMVRYDPTIEEHKKFEINKDKVESSSESSSESEMDHKSDDEEENDPVKNDIADVKDDDTETKSDKNEDLSKFFHVEPNLKDLFESKDVFKFEFNNDDVDKDDDEEEIIEKSDIQIKPLRKALTSDINFGGGHNKSKYSSSSESESDEAEASDKEHDENDEKIKPKFQDFRPQRKLENVEESAGFFPDFENSKDIKEALVYFCRSKDLNLDEYREQWSKQRELLIKECKRKHKKVIRIKNARENEKLPWKHHKNTDMEVN